MEGLDYKITKLNGKNFVDCTNKVNFAAGNED